MSQYTPVDDIAGIRASVKAAYATGKLRSIEARKDQLLKLAHMLDHNAPRWIEALNKDLNRPALESEFIEFNPCIAEAMEAYHSVGKWAKDESPAFDAKTFLMAPKIRKEPKGTCLIIGPFNFPLWCVLGPLAGAIAAGCAVVIKPSELTPATSEVMIDLLPKYLDSSLFQIVTGTIPETTKLLELQWDHIMYTGSGRVGKIVATAAAKHLTPTTLELGGKNPVFVDPNTDLATAAKRILWSKVANAGQICVAADYILIPKEGVDKFVAAVTAAHKEFFPDGATKTTEGSRMASPAHAKRLEGLIKNTKGKIVVGGESDVESKWIAPTVVRDVTFEDSLMSEELFGPVLPIVGVDSYEQGIEYVNAQDDSLCLYAFTSDATLRAKIFDNTRSGACVSNDCIVHAGVAGIPFGGRGGSGYGAHTGYFGFKEFTHNRATITNPFVMDLALKARYPPYTESKRSIAKQLSGVSVPKSRSGGLFGLFSKA